MDYNEYIERMRKELQNKMGEDFKIAISQVKKNNGIVLQGISIIDKANSLSPTFYLNDQFPAVEDPYNETRIREAAADIIRVYYDHCLSAHVDLGLFKSYQKMKDKILFRLINFQKNKDLLSEVPHKRFYDLAMVFYIDVKNDFFENGTILLYQTHIQTWNITLEDLFTAAIINTPRQHPVNIQTMSEIIKELLEIRIYEKYGESEKTKILLRDALAKEYNAIDEKEMMQDGQRYKMYVAGNVQKLYGAAVMLYPEFIKNFASEIQADLYIFPSSVHEIIIVPAKNGHDRAELLRMVCEINASQVSPEEVLADTVYFYQRSLDVLEMITMMV